MPGSLHRRAASGAAAVWLLAALTACGSDDGASGSGGEADPDAEVTITVGNLPPTEQPETRQAMLDQIEEFEAEHPNITVEAEETEWTAETFNAMVAGGTLPTVVAVPFTEIRALISREQVADLASAVEDSEAIASLSPTVMEIVTEGDGIYGIPYQAYTMGLIYNRALFEQAGLDPDEPPRTWDDVRAAARTITEETGQPGFISMTAANSGGWALATMSYAFGGQLQEADGDMVTATVDNDATEQALEYLRTLRWEDNSMGANFLIDFEDSRNEFAAGRAGMFVHGTDIYEDIVVNRGLPSDDFGVAPLPQDEDGIGTLGGGAIDIVSPRATPEQIAAAVEWIEFHRIAHYADEERATTSAESRAADGLPVGAPELPIVDAEQYEAYLGWIEPHVNVPREHFDVYTSSVEEIPLVPEPPIKAQEVYAALDPVVQAVLTREDADIDALLDQAQSAVDALIAAS